MQWWTNYVRISYIIMYLNKKVKYIILRTSIFKPIIIFKTINILLDLFAVTRKEKLQNQMFSNETTQRMFS